MHLYLNDGEMEIRCYPEEEQETRCRDLFETIFRGYELLAEKYPEHITTDIGGDNDGEHEIRGP